MRAGALVMAGMLAGAVLLTPAVAHVGGKLRHLFGHADKRYPRVLRAEMNGSGFQVVGGPVTHSSVTLNAPTPGVLVIHGSAHFNNQDATGEDGVQLNYQVDEDPMVMGGQTTLGPDLNVGLYDPGETGQVGYVAAVQVAQGPHTVTQSLSIFGDPGYGASFSGENLVVEFWPRPGAQFG